MRRPMAILSHCIEILASILDEIDCCSVRVLRSGHAATEVHQIRNVKTMYFSGLLRPLGHLSAALRASVVVGTPEFQSIKRAPF
jgi:hypothetical protein